MELAFDRIAGTQPERSIAFLHGILGSGRNLQTFAKRFVEQHPQWVALLVDLRGHGRSPKGTKDASLTAAALDVVQLAATVQPQLAAIAGHSFGGKLALETARLEAIPSLKNVVVIDSMPGAREPARGPDSALAIIEILKSFQEPLGSVTDFVRALERAGIARPVGQWLAGSLDRQNDGLRFGLNLEEIRALVIDYFARDLWPVVERPPGDLQVHLVIGDQSDAYSTADRERAVRIASSNPRVSVDILRAGHWVHVDNLEGLLVTLTEFP